MSRSFARVGGDVNFVLTYGDSEGYAPLREAIAERMRARGCAVDARDVLVLTGSTQGITLVAQSLAEPGDEIVVEAPTYPGALQIFQIAGLRAIPVPVDEDGMRVDHVEAILRTRRPRFIYTMPSLHNPTGVTMSAERRDRLVDARAARTAFRSSRTIRTASSPPPRPRRCSRATPTTYLPLVVLEDDRAVAAAGLAGRAAHDLRTAAPAQAVVSTWRRRLSTMPACARLSAKAWVARHRPGLSTSTWRGRPPPGPSERSAAPGSASSR